MNAAVQSYWRPAYEFVALGAWLAAIVIALWFTLTSDMPAGPFIAMLCVSVPLAWRRLMQGATVWRHRAALAGRPVSFVDTRTLARKMRKKPDCVWFGYGFPWGRAEMQRFYDLQREDLQRLALPAPFRPKRRSTKGNPAIHGIVPREKDIYVPLRELEGHLFVVATTGAMKTRFMALLAAQAIRRTPKETVIIIDPKGDNELRDLVHNECERAGRAEDFAYFHPAFPSKSVRIDVLRNYKRVTELASRVAALMGSESEANPFKDFGWRVVNLICEGLIYGLESRPTLAEIRAHVEGGPDKLVHNTIIRFMASQGVVEWRKEIKPYFKKLPVQQRPSATTPEETIALVNWYKSEDNPFGRAGHIDSLVSMFEHNREHLGKMIASLIPILTQLTAADLHELLSPNRADPMDDRPILDSRKIVDTAMVLFAGLDSLSDQTVCDAIGSILLADMASVAGYRYNNDIKTPRVNLFVDEANQVANAPFISLLNKGRGAGFSVVFMSQSVMDFQARLGNEALMRQVLANANNTIAGRTKCQRTMEYVTEALGRAPLVTVQHQHGANTAQGDVSMIAYSSAFGVRTMEEMTELFPPEVGNQMPDLEYIGIWGGDKIYKGRIPIVR